MKYRLHDQDTNGGNEDTWDIIISDGMVEVRIIHWWSHKDGQYEFKTGKEELTLNELKTKRQWLYKKAVSYLTSIGYDVQ